MITLCLFVCLLNSITNVKHIPCDWHRINTSKLLIIEWKISWTLAYQLHDLSWYLFFFFNFYLFFYFWLCWVFISVRGLSLVAASGGHSSSRCAGLSLLRPLLLRSTGSRRAGSVIVAHGPSCSAACGIFPDQGSNPYPLHWQADSQPLRHQGSPYHDILISSVRWATSSCVNLTYLQGKQSCITALF